jgi:hypothetical protein
MIISQSHNFGFVHIAKCAGSTIRQQLRDKDDLGGRFYKTMTLPGLGRINANHLSLQMLRDHFPEELAQLKAVTSYTLTRDPMGRFVSGISQLMRDRGMDPGTASHDDVLIQARGVMVYLNALDGFPDLEHILFARQIDYVMLEGEKIVSHVCAMEDIDALFDVMATRHDLHLMKDTVWNPTVTYKVPALSDILNRAKWFAQKVLPLRGYVALRDFAAKKLTTKGAPQLSETLRGSVEISDFVERYYANDRALHAQAQKDLMS